MQDILQKKDEIELRLISPIDPQIILQELTNDAKKIATTPVNEGSLEIYIIQPGLCENTLKEIGRLRELMFSITGGGTGKDCDLDEFDDYYCQLVSWDPIGKEIVSGYRYILGCDIKVTDDKVYSAVGKLFQLSPDFIENKLLNGMELGRSFSNFFAKKSRHGLYVIWYGLGYLTQRCDFKYFFGKVTFYPLRMKEASFDTVLYFLENQFPTKKDQAKALKMYEKSTPLDKIEALNGEKFDWEKGYEYNYQILRKKLKFLQEHLEPLLKSYMDLSKDMEVFDSSWNEECGMVVEILIVTDKEKIDEMKITQFTSLDFNF